MHVSLAYILILCGALTTLGLLEITRDAQGGLWFEPVADFRDGKNSTTAQGTEP